MARGRVATWVRSLPGIQWMLMMRLLLQTTLRHADALHGIASNREIRDLLAGDPRYADPKRLARFGFEVNSQAGEDGILREIFRRIGTETRVFAEAGAGDGRENNTAFLLPQGWRGFWLDGNEAVLNGKALRPYVDAGRLTVRVAFLTRENIAGIFREMGVPGTLDLLSVDVDQNTYYLWEALHALQPRVVVAEYNSSIPPEIDWKVRYASDRTWDGTRNFGASLKALERLGERLGYRLVGCNLIGSNAFFVRADLVGDAFAAPFTAENHYEPPRFELVWQRSHATAILDAPE